MALADIDVTIHPVIRALLDAKDWGGAYLVSKAEERQLIKAGYYFDGLKVVADQSWSMPFKPG